MHDRKETYLTYEYGSGWCLVTEKHPLTCKQNAKPSEACQIGIFFLQLNVLNAFEINPYGSNTARSTTVSSIQ